MSNPILNEKFAETKILEGEPMTINGTVNKSLLLIGMIVLSAAYTWYLAITGFMDKAYALGFGGMIAAFIAVLVMYFTRSKMAPLLSAIYAIGEGFFLGGISAYFEAVYPGIVLKAVACSFAAMFSLLLLYSSRIIRCSEKFRAVIFTATMSIAIVYLIQIVASFFGRGIPQIFTASPVGIGFSVVVVLIAAFNFILDFDFIERASEGMAPKAYEWLGAVGLMTSLVWLYIELLRLFAKLNDRN